MAKQTFFRNKEMITDGVPEPIDAKALWVLYRGSLVLVDLDQHIALDYKEHKELFNETE